MHSLLRVRSTTCPLEFYLPSETKIEPELAIIHKFSFYTTCGRVETMYKNITSTMKPRLTATFVGRLAKWSYPDFLFKKNLVNTITR